MTLDQPFQPYIPLDEHSFHPFPFPAEPSQPALAQPLPPITPPPPEPALQPLRWLWPGRLPQGKLTLLDGSPTCGTSLFALTLAIHVATGRPWPDGSPCPQGTVLFLSPHDSFRDTILPRMHALGADKSLIMPLSHVSEPTSTDPRAQRPVSLTRDLAFIEQLIHQMHVVLLILDPFTAFPGWKQALPALIDLAARTHCAIVLTRSLARTPSDLLQPRCPASPVLTATRSHLLLVPDPSDERHCLLLTPKRPLCAAPAPLAYTITPSPEDVPTVEWLPAPDPASLRRLATGPIHSPQRQAILQFLRACPNPQPIKAILAATSYDYEAGRKMLLRMKLAGELVSPASGLYTIATHPCLPTPIADSQSNASPSPVSVPDVPVPAVPAPNHPSIVEAFTSCGPFSPSEAQEKLFPHLIARGEAALAEIRARLAAQGSYPPSFSLSNVPCPDNNPPNPVLKT